MSTDLVIPDGFPIEAWTAFLAMRKGIKKAATEYAQKLLIKKLKAHEANGQDIESMLNQSIINSWQDVYPVKDAPQQYSNAAPLKLSRQRSSNDDAKRLLGIDDGMVVDG